MWTPLRCAPALLLAGAAARADDLSDALDDLRVRALVSTLGGNDVDAKRSAAVALAGLGEPGTAALVRGLDSDDADARGRCVAALRLVTSPPAAALPRLIRMLGEAKDDAERSEIASALVRFGEVAQQHAAFYLSAATGNANMPRRFAYLGLARMGPTPEAISAMIDGLNDRDPKIQAVAVTVLAPKDWSSMRDSWREGDHLLDPVAWRLLWTDPSFSRHRPAILDRLVPLLRHPGCEVRALAANGLGRAEAPLPNDALQALTNALADPDDEVRSRAAAALARLVEHCLAPHAVLLSMLGSQDHEQQRLAARAAWHLGADHTWSVPGLKHVWEAPESLEAKEAAAAALGKLGAATDEMVGQLAAAYADIDPWSVFVKERRDELAGWLGAMKGAYPILVEAAKGTRRIKVNYWYRGLDREDAVRALEAFPERKDETIAVLRGLLGTDEPWDVGFRAAELMQRFGVPKDAYERRLGELIDAAESYWLVIATQLLLRAEPGSQRAVPRLLRALSETSRVAGGQPFEIAKLLADIGRLPPAAKAPLLRAARSSEPSLRAEALCALGHLADPDEEVRSFLWATLDSSASTDAAKGLAGCVRSAADLERLLVRARGLDWTFFELLAGDPAVADTTNEVLRRMVKDGADLPFLVRALGTMAPKSEAAREVHLRLLRSEDPEEFAAGWAQQRWWLLAHGRPEDSAFVPPLARGLFAAAPDAARWWIARDALLKVAGPEDLARIARSLEEALSLPGTKREALVALGEMGPRAATAVPAIRELEADRELATLAREMRAEIER